MSKSVVYLGATIGGIIGGYLPVLFGVSMLSAWSILTSTVGGILGVWAVYKLFD